MRPTPASRPTDARPVRRTRRLSRSRAARAAGAALLAGSLTAGPAFAQGAAPRSGQMRQVQYEVGAELPRAAPAPPRTKSKPKRGFFAKLFRIPSKGAAAGRAPGGPPPPPPAPHLKYARRSAPVTARAATPAAAPTPPPAPAPIPTDYAPPVAAARSAPVPVRAVRPSPNGPVPVRPVAARPVAVRSAPPAAAVRPARPVPPAGVIDEGVAPPPSPRRYETPRVVAAPARVAPAVRPGRPIPRETTPRSVPFASTAAPVAAAPPSSSGRAGRVSLKSPAPPPARRVAVPPTAVAETAVRAPAPAVLVAEDAEFFPELSEAAADRLPLAASAPAEPAAPTGETPVLNPPAVPDAPARLAAAEPVKSTEDADEATGDDSPFTGLSLAAPEPAKIAETEETSRTAGADLALDATDDEEAGWDLALAAADPVERESEEEEPAEREQPTLSLAAPAPAAPETPSETVEKPAIAPRSAAPARLARAPKTARIPARTASRQVNTPGRPDPTKLLAKLAARADRSLMMGFCPVTLRDDRDLVEGDERFTADFEGVTYRFATAAARDAFKADPIRYAPTASGRDLVIASTGWGETVGSLAHAAWYRGRLYLFASRESMRRFVDSPRDYLGG